MKYRSKRILVGIEDCESSTRVVEYVADLASGDGGFVIHVLHAVGPVPLELREFRGAEDPKTEEKLDSLLHRKREKWIETAKSQARSLLENVTLQLSALEITENTITSHVIVLDHKEDLNSEILETASRNQCGTIIVGQSSFPWFKGSLRRY
jgi:nucleotide-binding universal stress UspA family protein